MMERHKLSWKPRERKSFRELENRELLDNKLKQQKHLYGMCYCCLVLMPANNAVYSKCQVW